MKKKVIKINEGQYRCLIGETSHYPKFLDKFKNEVVCIIHKFVMLRLNNKIGDNIEKTIQIQNNKYCDTLQLIITFYDANDNDILDFKKYSGYYYAENGVDSGGKIITPMLILRIPLNYKGGHFDNYNNGIISTIVSHEMGHLYDDWQYLRCNKNKIGNEKIQQFSLNDENQEIHNLLSIAQDDQYLNLISKAAYLAVKTERQSFISQVYQELKHLKINKLNYQQCYKKLVSFQNYNKIYTQMNNFLNDADEYELYIINQTVFNSLSHTQLPKMNPQTFNGELYKKKLYKFNQWLYKDFLKRLGGIIMFYIEENSVQPNHPMFECFVI